VEGLIPLAWIAATLALFLLYDPDFGASALRPAPSFGAHAARFGALAAATFGIGSAAHLIQGLPVGLALGWLLLAWSMTLLWRLFAAAQLGRRAGATGAKGLGPRPVLQEVGGYLKVEMRAERPIARANAWLKAAEDTLLGGLATLLLLPLLALIAVAIKLDSPGPVLFTQRRHGLNNDEFDIFKFRSMRSTEGGAHQPLQQTLRGDSRVTRVGRFLRASSLDELPQLLNVLLGQMSLVGPRPHAIDMRTQDLLGPEIAPDYAHRHRVKPGITGWAQVNGARGATHTTGELARRIELDLDYIAHWSLGLDLKIMLMTVRTVIGARNAF
jgi:lipopolysaccharide/colanic/teichoic acid biosynthesis glycosyltransferase